MRQDMKKVLTESPRAGSSDGYRFVRQRENSGDYDNLPTHQGIRAPHVRNHGGKEFTDHISPLIRYLWSCVGRSWNDVWKEICERVPSNNTVDGHLKSHVFREIELKTIVINDEIVTTIGRKPTGLYVDPRDGLIHANLPDYSHKSYKPFKVVYIHGEPYYYDNDNKNIMHPLKGDRSIMLINEHQKAVQIKGIWYVFNFKKVAEPKTVEYVVDGKSFIKNVTFSAFDELRDSIVTSGVYHTKKRQLSSKELKRYHLVNSAGI